LARASAGNSARVTDKTRQPQCGNPLRHAIRNYSAVSDWRNRARRVSTNFRERVFPKRPVASNHCASYVRCWTPAHDLSGLGIFLFFEPKFFAAESSETRTIVVVATGR